MKKIINHLLFFIVGLQVWSCKKFIQVDAPTTNISSANVYTTDATAAAVLTDIYAQMSSESQQIAFTGNIVGLSLFAGVGADELLLLDVNDFTVGPYFQNKLNKAVPINFWESLYRQIFATNTALEGISVSAQLTPSVKKQLTGEAKFMRAFCYFYLVNLYGDVPLVLNLDYKTNSLLPRSEKSEVYNQIINDLNDAKQFLSEQYLKGDALTPYGVGAEERVRPTRWAASALLATVYDYIGDYASSEREASVVIDNDVLFNLESLDKVFLKNNREAIWQLQSVGTDFAANTGEGRLFILPMTGPDPFSHPVYLSERLVNAFEPGDLRKANWIDSVIADGVTYYYPYKYKVGDEIAPSFEYSTIIRLSELFLIRAEARAHLNNIVDAKSDLDVVRTRAGLNTTLASNKDSLLVAIWHERQVELFSEWGHRWLDLKRSNQIDEVLTSVAPAKGSSWQSFQAFYPIPEGDVLKNPNLQQNQGY